MRARHVCERTSAIASGTAHTHVRVNRRAVVATVIIKVFGTGSCSYKTKSLARFRLTLIPKEHKGDMLASGAGYARRA